jgi:formylglycine-generating enzyme required for sulfatase activity
MGGKADIDYLGRNEQGQREFGCPRDDSLLVEIPPGRFLMGSTVEEALAEYRRSPLCGVALEEWFLAETPPHEEEVGCLLMDKYAVTNLRFSRFVEETRYRTTAEETGLGWHWDLRTQKWKRAKDWNWRSPFGKRSVVGMEPQWPAVQLSWEDASAYCEWAGKRLPSEAEWEYACRAGSTTRYFWGHDLKCEAIGHYAWHIGNAKGTIHEVGLKKPNAWGLHDMSGNIWEWVADVYAGYPGTSCECSKGNADRHVLRGGAWYFHPAYLRSAYRGTSIKGTFVGFRCVMDIPQHHLDSRRTDAGCTWGRQ